MTVKQLADLATALEDEWGVKAAAGGCRHDRPHGGGGDGGEAAEEQTEFNVILADMGAKKINVIKAVRGDHRSRSQGGQGARRKRSEHR